MIVSTQSVPPPPRLIEQPWSVRMMSVSAVSFLNMGFPLSECHDWVLWVLGLNGCLVGGLRDSGRIIKYCFLRGYASWPIGVVFGQFPPSIVGFFDGGAQLTVTHLEDDFPISFAVFENGFVDFSPGLACPLMDHPLCVRSVDSTRLGGDDHANKKAAVCGFVVFESEGCLVALLPLFRWDCAWDHDEVLCIAKGVIVRMRIKTHPFLDEFTGWVVAFLGVSIE